MARNRKRKLTDDEKKRIKDLWDRGRPLDIINRGWTQSVWIAEELKLSQMTVRAVIANLVRDPSLVKNVEKREVERLLLEARRPNDVLAGETKISPWIARKMKIRERNVAG